MRNYLPFNFQSRGNNVVWKRLQGEIYSLDHFETVHVARGSAPFIALVKNNLPVDFVDLSDFS